MRTDRLLARPTSPRRCTSATCAPPSSGTALARSARAPRPRVIRQNHIGDWGTPFGMLIEHLLDVGEGADRPRLVETDPNAFYQEARAKFDSDPAFAERARSASRRPPGRRRGDAAALARARRRCPSPTSPRLDALGVTLDRRRSRAARACTTPPRQIVRRTRAGAASPRSATALCASSRRATPVAEGKPVPLIIRKRDGGYGYAHDRPRDGALPRRDAASRSPPLRHRRAPGTAPHYGLGHRAQGRLAPRRRHADARRDRQRARRGRQDAQDSSGGTVKLLDAPRRGRCNARAR